MGASSIREQICAAVIAALSAASNSSGAAPAGLTIHRDKRRPIEKDSLPAIMIYFEDDRPETVAAEKYRAPLTERQLTLFCECRAIGSETVAMDQALDPVLVWTTQQVMQNETFGSLANGVEEGSSVWLSAEGDTAVAAATINFVVKYRTSRLDPTSVT